jgi:hypothetical protein
MGSVGEAYDNAMNVEAAGIEPAAWHSLFTGLELIRRVASLVPPPRANLTRFHGVFAPGAKLRPFLVP